jgi:carbamate kinase
MHIIEPLPLGVLVAGTAGWIGYMIQQSLQNALRQAGIRRDVLTVITQTEVDPDDPQLKEATKPIGSVLTKERADRLRASRVPLTPDTGKGVRRLAPSPEPIDVIEAHAVRQLLDEGKLVVAAGGGGTPVYRTADGMLEGVDAVVDKDRTAAILGSRIGATTLLILTDVDGVYRDWGTDRARRIDRLSLAEAVELDNTGSLGRGSMAPKLGAAIHFIRSGGQQAVIAALEDGLAALHGSAGTTITGERE